MELRHHERSVGGQFNRTETTQWGKLRQTEIQLKLDVHEKKRVYFQYAPWMRKSDGYLQLTYWNANPDGRSRVVNLDLATDTPIRKFDGTPRREFQTRWLNCQSQQDGRKRPSVKRRP